MSIAEQIEEMRYELSSLSPQWNLFGKIDRMKKILDNIERESITINYIYKKNK